MLLRSWI